MSLYFRKNLHCAIDPIHYDRLLCLTMHLEKLPKISLCQNVNLSTHDLFSRENKERNKPR